MNISSPLSVLERLNIKVFFLLLFTFQLAFIFQGIDLSDSGFYGTFYHNIFTAPETVQYNFMFWFSGIVGGTVDKLLPGLGLWGFRLAGVIVTTSTIIVTYNLLKNYLNPAYLKLGLLMVVLFINNNLKEIHYNDLSALLDMLAILFLFRGLKQDAYWKIITAGMFISLSTFTRLPNVLCLGLGLAILFYGSYHRNSIKKQAVQAVAFGAGFVAMTGIILAIMKITGHLEIFLNAVNLLSSMGSGGEESFYGPVVLIKNFINTYTAALKYTIIIAGAIGVAMIAVNLTKKLTFYRTWMAGILKYLVVALACLLFAMGKIEKDILLYFFTGLILVSTVLIVITKKDNDLKLLSLMGCYILVTYPFSSSAGLFTVGIYSIWLSLPIAIDYLYNIISVKGHFSVIRNTISEQSSLAITGSQLQQARNWTVIVCLFGCLVYTWYYPFFDKHDRLKMTSSIDSKYLRGILTTKDRAGVLNEVLKESSKYVKPGDYLLAYQTTPMLNYVTGTRPYMRNSYPWLYEAKTFKAELYKGFEETKTRPVVIMQKIKLIGASSNWPDPSPEDTGTYEKKNRERDSYLDEFIQKNNYREVWSNKVFSILVPH